MLRAGCRVRVLARPDSDRRNLADLVVEIVSPDDVERDTVIKRADYAAAGIPEYWIVHPAEGMISVLRLAGDAYVVHGVFHRGDTATSSLLQGFTVRVDVVCDAE